MHPHVITQTIVICKLVYKIKQTLFPELVLPKSRKVFTYYFESSQTPEIGKFLVLNGTQKGRINNVASLSSVSKSYAPSRKELLSVTVLASRNEEMPHGDEIKNELQNWFPKSQLRLIKSYLIEGALPEQLSNQPLSIDLPRDIHVCGDVGSITKHEVASIENAVKSGKELGTRLATLLRSQS